MRPMVITKRHFGTLKNGTEIYAFDFKSQTGFSATVLNYGAIIQSLRFKARDLVLGYDTLMPYEKNLAYFGAAIGRVANRIRNAQFEINGTKFHLSQNSGPHNLHSGPKGFEHAVWDAAIEGGTLVLNHISPEGTNGFPGTLNMTYRFTLTDDVLKIDMTAQTDRATLCNPTHHSYFNLEEKQGSTPLNINAHSLTLLAKTYTPIDSDTLPIGTIEPVKDTEFDFTHKTQIGPRAVDHNFVVPPVSTQKNLRPMAELSTQEIKLSVESTLPAVQIYTGDFIEPQIGKMDLPYGPRSGLAIEPQFFPDAPNCPAFPSIILRPDETYSETILYRVEAL